MAEQTKVQVLKDYFAKNHPDLFSVQDAEDEAQTTVFRSFIEAEGQRVPTAVFADNTIYVMIRVLLAQGAVKEENKEALYEYMNEQNRSYKVFKYSADANGDLFLDACIPAVDDKFEPELVLVILNVIVNHLTNDGKFGELMKKVWA